MLQNTPKNKRKDFGPKSSLPRRTGCQFTQNISPEGPKDRPSHFRFPFRIRQQKNGPKWRIREKTRQKRQLVKRIRKENKRKPKCLGMQKNEGFQPDPTPGERYYVKIKIVRMK